MGKKNPEKNEQSKLRTFLSSDRFKALLPLIGFVVIIVVMRSSCVRVPSAGCSASSDPTRVSFASDACW